MSVVPTHRCPLSIYKVWNQVLTWHYFSCLLIAERRGDASLQLKTTPWHVDGKLFESSRNFFSCYSTFTVLPFLLQSSVICYCASFCHWKEYSSLTKSEGNIVLLTYTFLPAVFWLHSFIIFLKLHYNGQPLDRPIMTYKNICIRFIYAIYTYIFVCVRKTFCWAPSNIIGSKRECIASRSLTNKNLLVTDCVFCVLTLLLLHIMYVTWKF